MSIGHQMSHKYYSTGYHVTIPQNITNQLPTSTNHRVALSTITNRNNLCKPSYNHEDYRHYTKENPQTNPHNPLYITKLELTEIHPKGHSCNHEDYRHFIKENLQENPSNPLYITELFSKTRPKGHSRNHENYRHCIKENLRANPRNSLYMTKLEPAKTHPKGHSYPLYPKETLLTITSQKSGINTPFTIPPKSKTHPAQQIPLYPITYPLSITELEPSKTRPKGHSSNHEDYRHSIKENLRANHRNSLYMTKLELAKTHPKGHSYPLYPKETQLTITSQKYGINAPFTIPPKSKTHPAQQIPLYPITYPLHEKTNTIRIKKRISMITNVQAENKNQILGRQPLTYRTFLSTLSNSSLLRKKTGTYFNTSITNIHEESNALMIIKRSNINTNVQAENKNQILGRHEYIYLTFISSLTNSSLLRKNSRTTVKKNTIIIHEKSNKMIKNRFTIKTNVQAENKKKILGRHELIYKPFLPSPSKSFTLMSNPGITLTNKATSTDYLYTHGSTHQYPLVTS